MIVPSLVNYVGKAANLYPQGYHYSGSVQVISNFLRTTWLWNRVRVQGGAYGAFSGFSRISGVFTFVSYRDPNLLGTLDIFDGTADYLEKLTLGKAELTKSIIGAIGDIDAYMLPDAKGYTVMQRFLNGNTDGLRQQTRDEILATSPDDFKAFAAFLRGFKEKGIIKVLGSENAISEANRAKDGFLKTFTVL